MTHTTARRVWYRYELVRYAPPLDEWENPCGSGRRELVLRQIGVKNDTPKGVRLEDGRVVLHSSRKRYACATKEEALESFKCRCAARIRILKAHLSDSEYVLQLANEVKL